MLSLMARKRGVLIDNPHSMIVLRNAQVMLVTERHSDSRMPFRVIPFLVLSTVIMTLIVLVIVVLGAIDNVMSFPSRILTTRERTYLRNQLSPPLFSSSALERFVALPYRPQPEPLSQAPSPS